MEIEKYNYIIESVLRKVPKYIRDDCRQAAYIGLLKAYGAKDVENFKSYASRAIRNEVIKEVAKLHGPGNGLFSMEDTAFLQFCKFKKKELEHSSVSDKRIETFNKLNNCKRYTYTESYRPEEEWND